MILGPFAGLPFHISRLNSPTVWVSGCLHGWPHTRWPNRHGSCWHWIHQKQSSSAHRFTDQRVQIRNNQSRARCHGDAIQQFYFSATRWGSPGSTSLFAGRKMDAVLVASLQNSTWLSVAYLSCQLMTHWFCLERHSVQRNDTHDALYTVRRRPSGTWRVRQSTENKVFVSSLSSL